MTPEPAQDGDAQRTPSSGSRATYVCWVACGILALFLASSVRAFIYMVPRHSIADHYMGPLYFVDYSDGFIRRGLPGEVLGLVWEHSRVSVEVAGWSFAFIALLSVIAIVWHIARLGVQPLSRCLVACLILLSPVSVTALLRDPGRYDAVGIAVLALALWWSRRELGPIAVVSLAMIATVIAVASEEFLILLLAPAVVGLLYRKIATEEGNPQFRGRLTKRVAGLSALCLTPALALGVASAVTSPSPSYLASVGRAAGPVTDLENIKYNPLYFLGTSLGENVSYVSARGPGYVVVTGFIWGLIYVISIAGVSFAAGRWTWWHGASAAYFGLLAIALSVVALDARRWWTLAFLGHLTLTGVLSAPGGETFGRGAHVRFRRAVPVVVAFALVVSVYGQSLPNTVRKGGWRGLSDYAGHGYAKRFVPFWLRGKPQL